MMRMSSHIMQNLSLRNSTHEKNWRTLLGTNSSVSRVIESAKDVFNHAQNSGVFLTKHRF